MKKYILVILLIWSSLGWAQIYVESISNDSIALWQTDKYFVYDYMIKNTSHDVLFSVTDNTDDCDSLTVKYSLDNNFITGKIKLPIGVSNLKVWVRANRLFERFLLQFSMVTDSSFFKDSIQITMNNTDGEYLFQYQVTDWIDFNSDRYEKIELQLYDSLWNLVSTIDSNADRIMVRNLKEGRYYLKAGTKVLAFDKINPESYFEEPTLNHSTNQ